MSYRSQRLAAKIRELVTESLESIADTILDLEDQIEADDAEIGLLRRENAELASDIKSLERGQ